MGTDEKQGREEYFLQKLTQIVLDNLTNEQFSVEELAVIYGISRSQLHKKLKKATRKSVSQFIREIRLEEAMKMLREDTATVSEIAYQVGFSSPTYFNTRFKELYGYPPGEVKFRSSAVKNSQELSDSSQADASLTPKETLFGKKGAKKNAVLFSLIGVLVVTTFTYYFYSSSKNSEGTALTEPITTVAKSIAVLPFTNMSGKPENDPFCDGMTDAVISRLSQVKGFDKVLSRTSMMRYKNTEKTMPEIAAELDVSHILESSFQKDSNDIKINLRLIDAPLDKLFWSYEYTGRYDSIFKIQAEVSQMVMRTLNVEATNKEIEDFQKTMTDNPEAYDNYLKGDYLKSNWTSNAIIDSRKYFEKAIELDPQFVEAHIKLYETYMIFGLWGGSMSKKEADSLAAPFIEKAIQVNPHHAEVIKALASKATFDWNFALADSLYQAMHNRGHYQRHAGMSFLFGRYDKVIENGNSLLNEDPMMIMGRPQIAYAYYHKGQKEEAMRMAEDGLRIHPNLGGYFDHFGNVYLALEEYERAREVLEKGLETSEKRYASMVAHLAAVYHHLGEEEKSLRLLNEVLERANSGEPEINVFLPHYYSNIGEFDEAFKWLDIAYEKHEIDMIWLIADPNLAKLRDDPRYKVLAQKVGFPTESYEFIE